MSMGHSRLPTHINHRLVADPLVQGLRLTGHML
jgi:hypothetical protein